MTTTSTRLRDYLYPLALLAVGISLHAASFAFLGRALDAIFFVYLVAILLGAWRGYAPGLVVTTLVVILLPFVFRPGFSASQLNWVGWFCLAAVSIVVSRTAQGRRHADQRLRALNTDLEQTVQARTDELHALLGRERAAYDEAEASRQRLHMAIASIGDGVIVTNEAGRITFLNPVAAALTEWTEAEARDRPLAEVFRTVNERTGAPMPDPARVAIGDQPRAIDGVLISRSGRRIPVEDTGAPIRDPAGRTSGLTLVFRDVSERRHAEEYHRQLAAIVESSHDAVVGKTLDGVVTSWNPGAERMYGYTAEEMIGRPISILTPPGSVHELPEILDRIRKGEPGASYEAIRQTKGGELIAVSNVISPIHDTTGAVVGASAVGRDVTERRREDAERNRLLERERAAREEADQANRMRDEFLATVSHELRGPLQGIVGYVPLLAPGVLDRTKTTAALDAIQRNARALTTLIEEMLDVSRIIAGKMTLDVRPVNLALVADNALLNVRPSADAKDIALDFHVEPGVGMMPADPDRIQQAIWNLLSNAVKFTPRGGHVSMAIRREEADVVVEVADDGIGIDAAFLPHVFERFRQAESTTTRRYGGLGLGLSVVRHIVESHGGTVEADSEGVERGTTFRLRLPVPALAASPGIAVSAAPTETLPANLLRGVTALVVDDHPDARKTIALLLERHGASVETATSVSDALETIKRATPHVLLSDIGMPGEDGLHLIEEVRRASPTSRIPAIAVTGFASAADRSRSEAAGFQVHLTKPVDPDDLVRSVAELVGRARVNRPAHHTR